MGGRTHQGPCDWLSMLCHRGLHLSVSQDEESSRHFALLARTLEVDTTTASCLQPNQDRRERAGCCFQDEQNSDRSVGDSRRDPPSCWVIHWTEPSAPARSARHCKKMLQVDRIAPQKREGRHTSP